MKIVFPKHLKPKVRKILKIFKQVKFITGYTSKHPLAVTKAILTLVFEGYDAFARKLARAQKRQRKYAPSRLKFSPVNLLKRLVTVLVSLCVITFYVLSVSIFFISYKFLAFFLSGFSSKVYLKRENLKLNGVSVIIPTWNKKTLVLACLKRLDRILAKENKTFPLEIIVIDNGSNDGTYSAIKSLKTKIPLTILSSDSNLGFARAINWGASQAKYNYLYLLNNDMLPKSGFMTELVTFARLLIAKRRPFFGLSSQIFFYDPKKRREESGKTYFLPDFGFLRVAHCVHPDNLLTPSPTGYPGGGSSLINKRLFILLGGYDHLLYRPLYDEDMDLGYTAWKLGFPSYFIPSSQVIHHHRSSSSRLNVDPNYYMFKNWLVFILKHYDSISLIIRHLVFYTIRMFYHKQYLSYALDNLKLIPLIYYQKLKLTFYRPVYKSKELLNFPKFELTHPLTL